MSAQAGHLEYILSLKARLEQAPWAQRGSVMDEAAAFLGRSKATLYRELEKLGFRSGRKCRADRGRRCVDQDLAQLAGGMVRAATRKNGKKTLGLTDTVEILRDNGLSVPHPATLARAMRAYGCHPVQTAAGSPHQTMRSLHPNHTWQMDASVCVLFYLPDGKAQVEKEERLRELDETLYNEKKPHNLEKIGRQRITRWVITDHASGSLFVRYREGAENQQHAIEVLIECMCARHEEAGDERDIFHGAPDQLYTDPGGPFVGVMMQGFLRKLGIRHIDHAPKNARATGQVENGQNLVETKFEGRLRFLEVRGLDELNAHARDWQIMFNATALHSRHGKTRNNAWRAIAREQLRVPESAEALLALVADRAVDKKVPGSLRFTYAHKKHGRQEYSLAGIPDLIIGREFSASVNPFSAPDLDVTFVDGDGAERIYTLSPIKKDRFGFDADAPVIGREIRALVDTTTDKAIKEMDKRAHGAASLEEAAKSAKAGKPVYQDIDILADIKRFQDEESKIRQLPFNGTMLETGAARKDLPNLNSVEAAVKLKARLAEKELSWDAVFMAALKQDWPDGVPAAELDGVAMRFEVLARNNNEKQNPLRDIRRPEAQADGKDLRVVGGSI